MDAYATIPTPVNTDFTELTNYYEGMSFIIHTAEVHRIGHTPACDLITKNRGPYSECNCMFMVRLMDAVLEKRPRAGCDIEKKTTDALQDNWFRLRETAGIYSLEMFLKAAIAKYSRLRWVKGWTVRILAAVTSPVWAPVYLLLKGIPKPCKYAKR